MRVFISQPMKGKSHAEILEAREEAIAAIYLKYPNNDVQIIESIQSPPVFDSTYNSSLWTLGASLKILSRADAAYFAKGWMDARGCRIEHQCCIDYGIPILD